MMIYDAGIQTPKAINVGETDEALYDQVSGINTRGTFLAWRQAAKRLPDGGRIDSSRINNAT